LQPDLRIVIGVKEKREKKGVSEIRKRRVANIKRVTNAKVPRPREKTRREVIKIY